MYNCFCGSSSILLKGWQIEEKQKNPFSRLRLCLWCRVCMLLIMSKLTSKAYIHPISPYRTIIRKTKNNKKQFVAPVSKNNGASCFLALAGFFISVVEASGCIQFVKQRRQVYLDSMMHGVNTNGWNLSTTEMGFLRFLLNLLNDQTTNLLNDQTTNPLND